MSAADILAAIAAIDATPREHVPVEVGAWGCTLYFDPHMTIARQKRVMKGVPAGDVIEACISFILNEAHDAEGKKLFIDPATQLPMVDAMATLRRADPRLIQAIVEAAPQGPTLDGEKKD